MVPSSKNTTADISAIPINVRKKTVRNFYKKYKDKYKKAADLFNEQF